MIPKIIHYVWVGDRPKPESVFKNIDTWRKYCPDYRIIEWNNEQLKKIKNKYVRQAVAAKKWAFVSDYMRLIALEKFGGIYMDTDVELTAPLDQFRFNNFFMGREIYFKRISIMTGLIGAVPHHPIIKKLLEIYSKLSFVLPDGTFDTTPNPERFCKLFEQYYCLSGLYDENRIIDFLDKCKIFPHWYFCFPRSGEENYAIHHFAGSWLEDYWRDDRMVLLRLFGISIIWSVFFKQKQHVGKLPCDDKEFILARFGFVNRRRVYAIILSFNKNNEMKHEACSKNIGCNASI